MERTDVYIQIITTQRWLLLPFIFAILTYFLVPKVHRLFLSIVLLAPWLQIGSAQELSAIAAAAKLTSGFAFLLVAFSAWTHPGPKRMLPGVLWLYPAMALFWIVAILGVHDPSIGVILRFQWLFFTISAISLVSTVVTFADFKRVVNGFTVGCIVALCIPISALILFPGESFLKGVGRFQPWGTNSNQIGMLFALSAPLLGYAMITWPKKYKPFLIFMLSLTLGMALLTASRQTSLAILMTSFPIIFVLSKRPIVTILGISIAAFGLGWIMSIGAEIAPMERMTNLDTGRPQLWYRYITEVFSQRPLTGLLGTKDGYYFKSPIIGMHPHSAWMNMMYHGGLMLFVPMFSMVIYSCYSGFRVWRVRKQLVGDPLLYSISFLLLLAMYVQGSFNQVVYWPTYTWSYLHVVMASFFICLWIDIRDGDASFVLRETGELWDEDEQEELEEFTDYSVPV